MMSFEQKLLGSVKVTLRLWAAGWEDFVLLETLKQGKFNEGLEIVVNKGVCGGIDNPVSNSG